MSTNGWFADPSGIHELRFFDGATWTEHVVDHGIRGVHHWRPAGPILVDTASWYAPTTIRPAGDYAATPGYPGAGWSQPSPPPIPPKSNHQLGIIAAVIALVVLVGISLATYAIVHDPAPTDPVATPSSPPIATASPKPTPTPAAGQPDQGEPTGPPSPTGKPAFNASARPINVVGPTFAAGEPTYTMAFQGWPFAFRVPSTFGCLKGKPKLPDQRVWVCINESNPGAKHRISIVLRPCPTTCTAGEQRSMTTAWFEEPGRTPIRRDATTSYLEFPSNDRGLYALDMSHFFGPKPGGPLRWQVGIYVESPTSTKATMHKVVNDVRSQTP